MRFSIFCLFTCFVIALSYSCKSSSNYNYLSFTSKAQEIDKMQVKFDRVFAMLTGHFSNQTQADTSSLSILGAQELINVPFWRERTGESWFYSGWFKDGFIENAIRENIFQLNKKHRDTFELLMYAMPDDRDYSMVWQKDKPFKHLKPADLKEVCNFYIVAAEDKGLFKLYTPGEPCQQNFSENISAVEFIIRLSSTGQQHYSVFYNSNKEEMLRYPQPNGIIFERLDKENPKYSTED